ncbi:MAG: tRNA (cytidine(56)-2'-O)-methyltransferase [Nitrosopumilus sp.]|nr:tRNA (cytidine(56)-2'-O)-methyltransferase [Nitrosopumilus sp.]
MIEREVAVLRIGHRLVRDDRTTTHAILVSRAFGSTTIYMTDVDEEIKNTINRVNSSWGGSNEFKLEIIKNWKNLIKEWKEKEGKIIHLTMYGRQINESINEIKSQEQKILVIIGAEKVPKEIYYLADYNISIGNQPHSEIAALAIFLDRLFEGKQFDIGFSDGKMKIIPSEKGKNVIRKKK